LDQPNNFYKQKRNATLTYLNAVYPQGKDSFNKLNDLELAYFYNSLWFYYNCSYQYSDNDLGSFTGDNKDTKWDPLPCATKYPLPYPPQGIFYNFWTYNKFNMPTIYSDSDESKEYLQLSNFGSGRPGMAGSYKNNKTRSSGIMWINARTIQRDIWSPNGLVNNKNINDKVDNWHSVNDQKINWNYPNDWLHGFKDNQYIEITHGPSNTGDAVNQSPWWWYNACIGSGIFLNLGKTFASLNKLAGVFDLSSKLAETSEGKQKLIDFYGSSDPYDICFGIFALCGYDTLKKQNYCDFRYCSCYGSCAPMKLGYSNATGITFNYFYNEIINYQKNVLGIISDIPTKEGIKASIDAARLNTNYLLAHISINLLADENCFFLATNLNLDTLQFVMDPNGNDLYVYEIIDLRIPERFKNDAKNRDYSGFIEIKNNINNISNYDAPNNTYKKEIINEYLTNAYDKMWISLRDPLDVYNNSKAVKCDGIVHYNVCGDKNSPAQSMFCEKAPLANAYKCLALGNEFNGNTCILTGNNPTC